MKTYYFFLKFGCVTLWHDNYLFSLLDLLYLISHYCYNVSIALQGKNLAVQSTTKPEVIFLNRLDKRIHKLGNLISLGHRELIYTFLGKGYVDAVAAHEESIVQYMKDYDIDFRILEESLMITGIGVAFAKDDDRGICVLITPTAGMMRQDGTSLKIIEKYLDNPEKYLEVDDLGY